MSRIINHFEKRKLLPVFFITAIVAVNMVLAANIPEQIAVMKPPLSVLTLQGFYYMTIMDDEISPIIFVMTLFLIFVPMVDFYRKDFNLTVTYCITRNKSRKSWYFQKVAGVLKISFFAAVIYRTVTQLVIFAQKSMTLSQFAEDIPTQIAMTALFGFYIAFWLLLLNDVALIFGSKFPLPVGVVLNVATALDFFRVQNYSSFGFRLNPLVNMFVPLHSESANLPAYGYEKVPFFDNFPIWSSFVYFILAAAAFITLGYLVIIKSDLGTMTED